MRILFVLPVMLYRIFLSPILGGACRFQPTCSEYAYRAILVHGVVKGLAWGSWRICRCQPFAKRGYDPVPGDGQARRAKA